MLVTRSHRQYGKLSNACLWKLLASQKPGHKLLAQRVWHLRWIVFRSENFTGKIQICKCSFNKRVNMFQSPFAISIWFGLCVTSFFLLLLWSFNLLFYQRKVFCVVCVCFFFRFKMEIVIQNSDIILAMFMSYLQSGFSCRTFPTKQKK